MLKSKLKLRVVYIFLVIARFFTCTFPGYIHPDEFFQGGQELFYGCGHSSTIPSKSTSQHLSSSLLFDKFQIENITPTWEFEHQHAIRSIVPPLLMTMFPLHVLYLPIRNILLDYILTHKDEYNTTFKSCDNHNIDTCVNEEEGNSIKSRIKSFNAIEIWIIPRLFMTLLSIFMIDLSLRYILTKTNDHDHDELLVIKIMIVYSSSWTTLLFLNRPFSNTLETILLTWLLYSIIKDLTNSLQCQKKEQQKQQTDYRQYKGSIVSYIIFGIICSFGLFTRFTFAFYAFPIVIIYIHEKSFIIYAYACQNEIHQQRSSTRWTGYVQEFVKISLSMLFGFLVASLGIIFLDSDFYNMTRIIHQPNSTQNDWISSITITPWNAFRYNSQSSNLSDHGIHPRGTHVMVNLPMLFGPLSLIFYFAILQYLYQWICAKKQKIQSINDNVVDNDMTLHCKAVIHRMCYGMIFCGLGVLSCAPHQEPRFLLPLIVPLLILHGGDIVERQKNCFKFSEQQAASHEIYHSIEHSRSRTMNVVWVIFNLLLLLFFGQMHQAGVIPSLLEASRSVTQSSWSRSLPHATITFHTYMPPTFLFRQGSIIGNIVKIENNLAEDCNIEDEPNDGGICTSSMNSILPLSKSNHHHNTCNDIHIIDLKGEGIENLVATIESILQCNHDTYDADNENYLYLIAPPVSIPNLENVEVSWKRFQISTEDMPSWTGLSDFISQSSLTLNLIRCSRVHGEDHPTLVADHNNFETED